MENAAPAILKHFQRTYNRNQSRANNNNTIATKYFQLIDKYESKKNKAINSKYYIHTLHTETCTNTYIHTMVF